MPRPIKIEASVVRSWMRDHAGWEKPQEGTLAKSFRFADFSGALAFVVHVAMVAQKRDHHPDIEMGWGRARVSWTTHDAGGLTALDLELAEATDALFG